jgi:hypothetical protein
MAAPTNTFQTYAAKGNREDLANVIYKIAPTDTPFLSGIEKVSADATYHEWQTQDLAAAADNAQIEGDDAAAAAVTPTVRLGNYTQISTKTIIVSGTQEEVKKAGRGSELGYQVGLKGQELKRDMETALTQRGTHATGAAGTSRQLCGLEGWIATNGSYGAGGAAPVRSTNTAAVDGTARAFTETLLKDVLQKVWTEGGKPDMLMMGGLQKQAFSAFSGGNVRQDVSEDKKVTATVEIYISDFGTVKAVPNRFQRARTVFAVQTDMWALATLRPMKTKPLADTGDSMKRMLVTEYTLEARQEKASGAIRDLS